MNDQLAAVTGIPVLATIAKAIVEHIFASILDARAPDNSSRAQRGDQAPEPEHPLHWKGLALRYVSVIIGIALCIVYNVDLLLQFGLVPLWPWVGSMITGLLIGRGANFVHDFATRWLTVPAD